MLKTILTKEKPFWPSFTIWSLGILIRGYLIRQPAQYYDIATFNAWGNHLLSVGPAQFFASIWSDYLPLPILLTGAVTYLTNLFNLPFEFGFKLIISLIELLLIYALTRFWPYQKKLLISALLLLSPVILSDSAYWGQIDTIPSLLTLLSTVLLLRNARSSFAGILFGLAVGIKPIMLLAAIPLWTLSFQSNWWLLPLTSILTFLLPAIPFTANIFSSFGFLVQRSLAQAGTYPFTTVNAWNLWSLVPQPGWISDSQPVLGLTAHTFGLVLFLLSLVSIFTKLRNNRKPSQVIYSIGLIFLAFFIFTTRMHERHLLFGLPFFYLALALNSKLLIPTIILTTSFSFNLLSAYYWVFHQQQWPISPNMISIISWVNLATTIYLLLANQFNVSLARFRLIFRQPKILIGILALATLLRFTNLAYPSNYIFDEVYHAFTAREYLHNHIEAWEWWTTPPEGVAYEWTHPPLAKYGMVAGMLLFGENSFGWRFGSAVTGVASILGLYLFVISLTHNHRLALLSAFLASIGGLHISQSRVAMNDSYMLCFYVFALYIATKGRWKGAAILYGLSLASKWSALYGVIPLAMIYLHQHNFPHWDLKSVLRHLIAIVRYALIAISIYVLSFAPFILAGHTWDQFVELHRQMWYYHTHLVATHDYQSTPLEWIFAARPVWYYVNYEISKISNIYAQGNPALLWLGLIALILQINKIFSFPHTIFYLLYSIFTLPWIFSPRIMFFYHYLPSSFFLTLITANFLLTLNARLRNLLLAFVVVGLLIVSPVLFGIPLPSSTWTHYFAIFQRWK
jgi:4-amino-4-deoxy-L-arabinose transferase-like glycosyltransferase